MARKNRESQTGEGSVPLELTERLNSDPRGLANELGDAAIQSPQWERLRKVAGSDEEAERVFKQHLAYLIENDPSQRRALTLTDMYLSVPEGANARDVLKGQIYGQPGRQYAYLNSFAGDEKESKGLAKKLKGAAGTAVQATWRPGLAYAGWSAADSAITGASWWSMAAPLKAAWAVAGTPVFYGLVGYALYRTAKHFWNKRKDGKNKKQMSRLDEQRVEELERIKNDFLAEHKARMGASPDYGE